VLGAIMVLALLPEYAQAHRDPAQLWEAIERMLTAQPRASEPRA
jgi:hypothetical protein